MNKEEIHLDDIKRILFGITPPEYLLEVVLRAIILYSVLIFVVRMLGKRTNSIMTITERAVFITLGAIVAMPMHGPTHGVLIGVIVLLCVMILQRGFTSTFFISRKWEEAMQGKLWMLVKDSVIDIDALQKTDISKQQLYELLREKDIRHLGQVQRAYMEAAGSFTVYKFKETKPGLSILPADDVDDIILKDEERLVCSNCGYYASHEMQSNNKCPNCDNKNWVNPSKEYVKDEQGY